LSEQRHMIERPGVGDLVQSKHSDSVVGMVIKCRPEEVVGAGWIPERFVVWWLDTDKRTTEFIGVDGLDIIQVISKAVVDDQD